MIRKIAGKKQPTPLNHLSIRKEKITTKKAIADLLVKTFSKNSSCPTNTKFLKTKQITEKRNINFTNSEDYNKPFTIAELTDSITKSHIF